MAKSDEIKGDMFMTMVPSRIAFFMTAACVLSACGGGGDAQPVPAAPAPQLTTLSARPDLVSGGEVLVQVDPPTGYNASQVKVTSGGVDVTSLFKASARTGTLIARVGNLPEGSTTLEASTVDSSGKVLSSTPTKLVVVSRAANSPGVSGPKETPFICGLSSSNLATQLDADCTANTVVSYQYRSDANTFKPFDPAAALPTDLANTTTSQGKTVKFIVRLERGTINRAIYQISFLHQPGTPLPDPWTTTDGWNGHLRYNFGGGCGGGHIQGTLGSGLDATSLGRGYAVATSTLNTAGTNCSTVLSADTLIMVKEHFVRRFGPPDWTVGFGGSGGAVQQYEIAQSYPGLLNGLAPSINFPSMVEANTIFSDCKLIRSYMTAGATLAWTTEQKRAVTGYATWATCDGLGAPGGLGATMVEAGACNSTLLPGLAFNALTNPSGLRCSLIDTFANVYGRNPKTQVVRRPLDNVGVQYGLNAVKSGVISMDHFLELNEKIGGFDPNGALQGARHAADPDALTIAYQTGRIQVAANLDLVPIISSRGYNDASGDLHDRTRDFQMRAKLDDLFGNHDNHVILIGTTNGGSAAMGTMQLLEMEKWLDTIAADKASGTLSEKVRRNKPATAVDTCWLRDGTKVVQTASHASTGSCNADYPPFLDPRTAAGAPLAETAIKCQLKAVDAASYGVTLTPTQVTRLNAIFPGGVCDYTKTGDKYQVPSRLWARF
jgi:hypothetical protein